MFENAEVRPMIAVKDLKRAEKFYGETLGLKLQSEKEMPMFHCKTGGVDFLIYESKYAGTNKANTLAWNVGSKFDSVMKELKSKGVQFEHYTDMPGTKVEGDVHIAGDMKLAWFKDPDGNILHVLNA